MKNNEKRMIAISSVIVVIIILGILLIVGNTLKKNNDVKKEDENRDKYVEILQDGTKINRSERLRKTIQLDGMEIKDIQLTNKNGVSVLLATATNLSNQSIEITEVKVRLYDENYNILEEMNGVISSTKPGESVQLNVSISDDYSNAYDLTIEKK